LKHKLIVDFEVSTCPDDSGALHKMSESAKEIMDVSKIAVTTDKGYYNGKDIAEYEQSGTTCYVPKTAGNAHAPEEKYNRKNFAYDAETDVYIARKASA
jgi:hypothetical protein